MPARKKHIEDFRMSAAEFDRIMGQAQLAKPAAAKKPKTKAAPRKKKSR